MKAVSFNVQRGSGGPAVTTTDLGIQAHGNTLGGSYVRYVGIGFNQTGLALQDIVANYRIRLFKYDLDGTSASKVKLSLPATVNAIDHAIEIDFGASGIGGAPNTTAGDGHYELDVVINGVTNVFHFYRLLGDVNGDGTFDTNDTNLAKAAVGQSSPTGITALPTDGTVNTSDVTLLTRLKSRKLRAGLRFD